MRQSSPPKAHVLRKIMSNRGFKTTPSHLRCRLSFGSCLLPDPVRPDPTGATPTAFTVGLPPRPHFYLKLRPSSAVSALFPSMSVLRKDLILFLPFGRVKIFQCKPVGNTKGKALLQIVGNKKALTLLQINARYNFVIVYTPISCIIYITRCKPRTASDDTYTVITITNLLTSPRNCRSESE